MTLFGDSSLYILYKFVFYESFQVKAIVQWKYAALPCVLSLLDMHHKCVNYGIFIHINDIAFVIQNS